MNRLNIVLSLVCSLLFVMNIQAKLIATTNAETVMTVVLDGGSAVKKLPAGVVLEVLQDNGDSLQVKDSNGLVGSVAKDSVVIGEALSNTVEIPKVEIKPDASLAKTETEDKETGKTNETPLSKLNKAFGIELFTDADLWEDNAETVAKRLGWPMESKTNVQSSYRLYAKNDVKVLGTRPYSLVLYAHDGKPDSVSMVFANKGDFDGVGRRSSSKRRNQAIRDFKDAVRDDAATIEESLTGVLGEPKKQIFGETPETRESVARWDWREHAILLASPKDEYVAVRVVRKAVADNYGRVSRVEGLRELLQNRVLKRENGDVVIEQIPMVNQGPKGYCVPATWERYLRYMEIPADMYLLAMAGNTKMGGGTYVSGMADSVSLYVKRNGCEIQTVNGSLDLKNISQYVNKGLPLMWSCSVSDLVEKNINQRNKERLKVTDWEAYIQSLKAVKKEFRDANYRDPDRGHMRMVIGYNLKTGEIAISDSWGNWAAERWITLEEAASTSSGYLCIIKW